MAKLVVTAIWFVFVAACGTEPLAIDAQLPKVAHKVVCKPSNASGETHGVVASLPVCKA